MCKLEQMYEIQKSFTENFFKTKLGIEVSDIRKDKKELVR